MTMIKFPYGNADFHDIITNRYFYIDRTDKIPMIEGHGKALLFLRPRRFGKSLLLSMLENYYDLRKAGEFDDLFGHLAIGRAPTPLRNRFLVLKWNFSTIATFGDEEDIRQAIHNHVNGRIHEFAIRYEKELSRRIEIDPSDAIASLNNLLAVSQATSYGVYLLLDEYDNFANEVLLGGRSTSQQRYDRLIRGEGMLKTIFKAVKDGTEGRGIDRVFIAGVSPVVMSDVTSGFNIASDIYLEPEFGDLCGFHDEEVEEAVRQVAEICRFSDRHSEEVLTMMRTFYDGYCFSYDSEDRMYNPTLVLYFLEHLQRRCSAPRKLLDSNLATDRNKIAYVSSLPHGNQVVTGALDDEQVLCVEELADRFGVEDMLHLAKDTKFMISLLYYFGVLTLSQERTEYEERIFRIPNLVIRRLYLERLKELMLPTGPELDDARYAAKRLYQRGEMQPLCDFIESRLFAVFDNRDYKWTNEHTVKILFLALLFNDTLYIMDSEPAIRRGYGDLVMMVRPDMRHSALLDILIEFKYIPLGQNKLGGEQIRKMSNEELAVLPPVIKVFVDARKKLANYRHSLHEVYRDRLRLNCFAVVAVGYERLVWEKYYPPRDGEIADCLQ